MKPTVGNEEGDGWIDVESTPLPLKPSINMVNLLGNCDLPRPQKFFLPPPPDKKEMLADGPGVAAAGARNAVANVWVENVGLERGDGTDLLRALQLSQTRAREAEARASATAMRSERIAALLQGDSLKLLAHRKWVTLLEIEVALLEGEKRRGQPSMPGKGGAAKEDGGEINASAAPFLALALCLGVAGVGLAVGYWYMFR